MGENGWEDGGIQKTRITPEGFRHFYPSTCPFGKDGLEPRNEIADAAIRHSSQPNPVHGRLGLWGPSLLASDHPMPLASLLYELQNFPLFSPDTLENSKSLSIFFFSPFNPVLKKQPQSAGSGEAALRPAPR